MCPGGKGTCRTKACPSFSPASPTPLLPACMWTNAPPCWASARQVSFPGIPPAPAIQVWWSRLAQFVAAVSVQACASSRACSPPWLEGLTQVSSVVPFICRAPWVTCVLSSHLLPSPTIPFWMAFTAHFQWGPVTHRRAPVLHKHFGSQALTLLSEVMGEIFTHCSGQERTRSLQRVFEPLVC